MKTSIKITKLYFFALLILPNVIFTQNQTIKAKGTQIQISSTLQTILEQAEEVYVPSGYTMDVIYNDAPDMAPIFLGLIMQRQKNYMDQIRNINHIDNYMSIISQIDKFLAQLAKAHNYTNPVNNSKMPPIQLQNTFTETIEGKYNDVYINKFGINPTTAKVTYLLDRAPNPNNTGGNTDEHAKIDIAEAPTEINLFGEIAPSTEKQNSNNNTNYLNNNTTTSSHPCVIKQICPTTKPLEKSNTGYPDIYYVANNGEIVANGSSTYTSCAYFKNNKLRWQINYKDHKKCGIEFSYEIDKKTGQHFLDRKESFINGQKEGMSYNYDLFDVNPEPFLRNQEPFVNGKIHGKAKAWDLDDSGRRYLYAEYDYENGLRNGIQIIYMENGDGRIKSRTRYSNGKRHGLKEEYSIDYKTKRYYLRTEVYFNNDKEHGEAIWYNVNGAVQERTLYNHGVKMKVWNSKGQLKYQR